MTLTLPKILDVPEKLLPFITQVNDYRYFLAEGGRGGSKSQSVGRILLYVGEKRNLRIVCGRETQNTISESVYSLMADLVRQYELDYEIQANKLIHRQSGTEITFRGFRQQGAFNIQGMEGIDIVWIDEAQALTKQTIDVLIPTIRKDTAKIYFTMNRHVVDDPAFATFSGRTDCLHVHINYVDNKFCTNALRREAEECLKKSVDDYEHIWLGKPLAMSEDAVFSIEELEEAGKNKHALNPNYSYRIAGFDIARYGDDKCSAVIIQQMGSLHWEVIHVDEWGQRSITDTCGKIIEIVNEYRVNKAIVDEDGIGGGALDNLKHGRQLDYFVGFRNPVIAYNDNKDYSNPRTLNTYKLKDLIRKGHLAFNNLPLLKELATLRYTYDHHQRKILVSKDKMRKDGVKSPNLADGLIMACSLIGEIKYDQEKQYMPNVSRETYSDSNLFSIAGIR